MAEEIVRMSIPKDTYRVFKSSILEYIDECEGAIKWDGIIEDDDETRPDWVRVQFKASNYGASLSAYIDGLIAAYELLTRMGCRIPLTFSNSVCDETPSMTEEEALKVVAQMRTPHFPVTRKGNGKIHRSAIGFGESLCGNARGQRQFNFRFAKASMLCDKCFDAGHPLRLALKVLNGD